MNVFFVVCLFFQQAVREYLHLTDNQPMVIEVVVVNHQSQNRLDGDVVTLSAETKGNTTRRPKRLESYETDSRHDSDMEDAQIARPSQTGGNQELQREVNIGNMASVNAIEGGGHGAPNVAMVQVNGFVYILANGKWDKIGSLGTCTISLYGKSLQRGPYSSPNGMMSLTSSQIDGTSIVTHVFILNGTGLQTKGANAWRLEAKQPNGGNATLAVRFANEESSKLFENSYKWIIESDVNANLNTNQTIALPQGGTVGNNVTPYGAPHDTGDMALEMARIMNQQENGNMGVGTPAVNVGQVPYVNVNNVTQGYGEMHFSSDSNIGGGTEGA